MEISQLMSFCEIVKTGSYSKASKHLFITQSAVSHQIKNLERELNIKLFERVGNMVRLTQGGKILSDAVIKFVDDLNNLKRISEDIHDSKTGSLTIATNNGIIMYFLPDIIRRFKKELPGIKFRLINPNFTSEILSMVSNGEVDLAIGPKSNQALSSKTNFIFWKSFERFLIMAKGHPLRVKKTITLADIGRYPLITYREGSFMKKAVTEAFIREKIPYEIIMEVDSAENIKKYVEIGVGISILSAFTLTPTDKHRIRRANVSHLFGRIDYGIHYRKDKYITTAMKQFVKFFAPELYDKLT